jgi:hypothetical protein
LDDIIKILIFTFIIITAISLGVIALNNYTESTYCDTYSGVGWESKLVPLGPFKYCMIEHNGKWVYRENVKIVIGEINYENERN